MATLSIVRPSQRLTLHSLCPSCRRFLTQTITRLPPSLSHASHSIASNLASTSDFTSRNSVKSSSSPFQTSQTPQISQSKPSSPLNPSTFSNSGTVNRSLNVKRLGTGTQEFGVIDDVSETIGKSVVEPKTPLPESTQSVPSTANTNVMEPSKEKKKERKFNFKAAKAALTLTPAAVEHLKELQEDDKFIRVSVRNKGCAGMSYHLEYVTKGERFDEIVEQDGVKVLVDSKALFSIIGSVMDWQENELMSKFVFRNPNIKDECGCGESFIV